MTCILDVFLTACHFTMCQYSVSVANWPANAGYSLCAQSLDGERCPFYGVAGCEIIP